MQNIRLYKCLLISPGDVSEDRDAVVGAVEQWNAHAGKSLEARIEVVRWEVHGVPDASAAPQTVLNRQLVDDCDFAVALFWTRIGTPTESFSSGSIEEIERMRKRGARVLIYFKNAPLPPKVDLKDVAAVRAFKDQMKQGSLFGEYGTSVEIASLVERHATGVVVHLQAQSDSAPGAVGDAVLTAPKPDVRVFVRAIGIIPDTRGLGTLLAIDIQNHSPVRVFVSTVGFKYGKGRSGFAQLFTDAITGSLTKATLDPGASLSFHALGSQFRETNEEFEYAMCIDEVGRQYRSSEAEMTKAMAQVRDK